MTTTRAIRDDVKNVLDYLQLSALAVSTNEVQQSPSRVSWHAHDPSAQFLSIHGHPTIDQYLSWVRAGAYSAVLLDASLIQISYSVMGGTVSGHRLAYVPCPYDVDHQLLVQGEPILDVLDLYIDAERPMMRSPIRFDYDPVSGRVDHPASHLTFNSFDCRIACVAPMHICRFIDFIFRHFYPPLHKAHLRFFDAGARW